VTPSDKIGILSTPEQKRVFSLPPSDTKQDFFTPLGHVFSCDPPDSFVQFYPPWTVFYTHFTPLRQFFHLFYPPQTVYFDNFTPSDIFPKMLPPRTPFLETPLGQKLVVFYPMEKDFLYLPDRAI